MCLLVFSHLFDPVLIDSFYVYVGIFGISKCWTSSRGTALEGKGNRFCINPQSLSPSLVFSSFFKMVAWKLMMCMLVSSGHSLCDILEEHFFVLRSFSFSPCTTLCDTKVSYELKCYYSIYISWLRISDFPNMKIELYFVWASFLNPYVLMLFSMLFMPYLLLLQLF